MSAELTSALSILAAAREVGERPLVIDASGTAWSYATLARLAHTRIEELALGQVALAGLVGSPTLPTLVDLLALLEAEVPLVGLHPRWTAAERERVLRDASPQLVLEEGIASGPRSAPREPGSRERGSREPGRRELRGGTLAVLYTSGTTGRGKGAILSRGAFLGAARASAERLGWEEDDRWLLAMPLAHVGGLSVVVRSLAARRTVVLGAPGPLEPATWVESLRRERVTLLSLVPTQLARLVAASLSPPASVRAVLLGGAACPSSLLERAASLGWPLRTTYGLTEMCSQVTTASAPVRSASEGSGIPLAGVELRIRDGRILVRSPFAMDGWLSAELPDPFDDEGFYDTGDLGELDAEGRLHVHVRRDDLVVSGGENVYPAEVEDALLALPGIEAACVVGLSDALWGQRVAAAIVASAELTDEAILAALRTELAAFKLPRALVRVAALPTNHVGKLDRAAVRALF